jgi:hypothetical protein
MCGIRDRFDFPPTGFHSILCVKRCHQRDDLSAILHAF